MLVIIQDRTEQNKELWAICDSLGCELAVKEIRKYDEVYGLFGKTFGIKDTLKAAGFKFSNEKIWWASKEVFLSLGVAKC